jgi:brefeldin A-resistance guanine nucleotide exchange factor 1
MFVRDSPALGTTMGLRISSPAYQTRRSGGGSREAELMAGFMELKRSVKDMKGWTVFSCLPPVF